MKKRDRVRIQKSYLTIGVITLVAVVALAGISYHKVSSQESDEQEAVVMAEAEWSDEDETENDESDSDADEAVSESEESLQLSTETTEEQEEADFVEGEVETVIETENLSFSGADSLSWPVQGDVILNYSMDQSVYFATLDQYKYNPALIIAGEVNDPVNAAANGRVISVEVSEETGETVTMEIGGGYELVYGQLKEVQASEGDYIAAGDLVGFLSEPTKYYSVEGCNLYFQMLKDGEPVNPLDYLASATE